MRCHGGKRFRRRKVPIDPLDSRGRHSTPMAVRRSSRAARCDATIEARDLSKRFGGTVAVDGLSFTVPPGRVTGFVGPNGAGKSTTMRLILGLDAPDGGSALLGGRPYAQLRSPMREVGALLDATALHPGRRADDHLLWLAQTGGLPRRRVGEVLEIVGLAPVARRRAGGFSLGMRQRLGIIVGTVPVAPWTGFAVFCAYAAVALLAAFWLVGRRLTRPPATGPADDDQLRDAPLPGAAEALAASAPLGSISAPA